MAFTSDDTFTIPSLAALGMSETLVLLLNAMIRNLPEPELRTLRATLQESVNTADDILYNMMISSTFEMLSVSGTSTICGEDVSVTSVPGSPVVGCTHAQRPKASGSNVIAPPPSPVFGTIEDGGLDKSEPVVSRRTIAVRNDAHVPPPVYNPTPDPALAPAPIIPTDNLREVIVSSRSNVGIPDYTHHPVFIRPGIPGPYSRPPIDPSNPFPSAYYVVTRGLYVGIFTNWPQCLPWVQKVSGSAYCKVKQWSEAMALYNSCLAAGSCEVVS